MYLRALGWTAFSLSIVGTTAACVGASDDSAATDEALRFQVPTVVMAPPMFVDTPVPAKKDPPKVEVLPGAAVPPGFAGLLPSTPGKSIDETVSGVAIDPGGFAPTITVTRVRAKFGASKIEDDGKKMVIPVEGTSTLSYSTSIKDGDVDVKITSIEVTDGKIVIRGEDASVYGFPIKFPITISGTTVYVGDHLVPTIGAKAGNVTDRDGKAVLPIGVAFAFQRRPARVIVYKVEDDKVNTDKVLLGFPLK